MNIVWIYDQPIIATNGGSERVTSLISKGLEEENIHTESFLIFDQKNDTIKINNQQTVENLYQYLIEKKIDIIINQIGFASWILESFLKHGGNKWKAEGGKIISVMHFSPIFPPNTIKLLLKEWSQLPLKRKIKRIGRILLLKQENKRTKIFHKESYKFIYNNSDSYVLLSSTHIPEFQEMSKITDLSKISIIPNPLTYDPNKLSINLSQKKNQVLIVSRLDEEQKKISYSLKAWKLIEKQCPNWTLEIVGTGTDEWYYHKLAKKYNLKRVIFHGHQEPLKYYQEASILLFTSPREGWGLTITEAMENGVVPIVVDTCPVFRDILNNNQCGILVKEKDIKAYANSILHIINNKREREELANKGLERAKAFELHAITLQWKKLLTNLRP